MDKRNKDEERKDLKALLLEKQKITRSLVLLLVASFVVLIGVLTAAWFAHNESASGNGMGVSAAEPGFELAVPARTGAEMYYNDELNTLGYLTGDNILTTINGPIRWVMRDESTDTTAADYRGFRPGSYGKLTFYILPKTTEPEYTFQINITGYYAEFEPDPNDPSTLSKDIVDGSFKTLAEKANGDTSGKFALAADYLKGHILFFQNRQVLTSEELNGSTDTKLYYSGRIENGSFTFDTREHQSTTVDGELAYQVDVYWIWPNVFGQMVLDNEDENLYGDALFSSKQSGSPNPRNELISYIAEHPDYFLHSTELAGLTTQELNTMMSSGSLQSTNALLALSNGYNAADQIIGENVRFILVELIADQN